MKTSLGEFKYTTEPYQHQRTIFEYSKDLEYYALWWEMGTGKTKVIIDTASYLFHTQQIDGVLIVSDKGGYMNWPNEEFPKHLDPVIKHRICYWQSGKKIDYRILTPIDDILDICCINIEAFSSLGNATQYARDFIRSHYVLMVIDEATSIKNPKAQRTKTSIMLGRLCDYRRILTGTPITQSPLDVFSQCEFLKSELLGFKSFVAFRAYFAVMVTMTLGPRSFQKIVGYRNLEQLTQSLSKFSHRVTKEECLDLPDKIYERVEVELCPEQERYYQELKNTAVIQHNQGLLTSTSALTTMNKLLQICNGHLRLNDGVEIDFPNTKIEVLKEILNRIGEAKVLIWCAFQKDVEKVYMALLGGSCYPVHYYGKTSQEERMSNLNSFMNDPNCKWFIGTAATGGKSLTLTIATYVIYYSNTYSLEDRLQSEDRVHRIGQKKNVTYIDLVTRGTVEQNVLKSLLKKEAIADQVLDNLVAML